MSEANGSDATAPGAAGDVDDDAPDRPEADRGAAVLDDARILEAMARLDAALAKLEAGVDAHLADHIDNAAAAAEVQRLNADRARIARSLDEAEARAGRLDEANREVSRRLVGAMEAIRGFIEKQK